MKVESRVIVFACRFVCGQVEILACAEATRVVKLVAFPDVALTVACCNIRPLPDGKAVELRGLLGQAHYNGKVGHITGTPDYAKGQYVVHMPELSKLVGVKYAKVKPVHPFAGLALLEATCALGVMFAHVARP